MAHILIVDDEAKMRHILRIMLEMKGYKVDEAGDGLEALEKIKETPYDLVIADIKMPRMDGMELLKSIQEMDYPIPVVFITAYGSIESAVEAMRAGAVDYITKPFEEEKILLTVERALGISRIMDEKRALKEELDEMLLPKDIICASDAMKKVLELARKVAKLPDTTVLITGESGVGKEVVARYIHSISPRSKKRFVAVNCAAITPTLLESELFGHEKGAFTGAERMKKGYFETAQGGTLFLDEVGDLTLDAQAKILRALQEKVIQRVGGTEEIPVDVRIICATNKDLEALVKEGKFREDLYFRINVFPIHIPPLRERKEDIIPLAEYFIRRFVGHEVEGPILTQGAKRILETYPFPGNVRELANAMERAVILAGGELPINSDHLSFLKEGPVEKPSPKDVFVLPPEGISLEELEKEIIRQALERTGNNQSAAARLLGLTRSKFRTRLKLLEKEER